METLCLGLFGMIAVGLVFLGGYKVIQKAWMRKVLEEDDQEEEEKPVTVSEKSAKKDLRPDAIVLQLPVRPRTPSVATEVVSDVDDVDDEEDDEEASEVSDLKAFRQLQRNRKLLRGGR